MALGAFSEPHPCWHSRRRRCLICCCILAPTYLIEGLKLPAGLITQLALWKLVTFTVLDLLLKSPRCQNNRIQTMTFKSTPMSLFPGNNPSCHQMKCIPIWLKRLITQFSVYPCHSGSWIKALCACWARLSVSWSHKRYKYPIQLKLHLQLRIEQMESQPDRRTR